MNAGAIRRSRSAWQKEKDARMKSAKTGRIVTGMVTVAHHNQTTIKASKFLGKEKGYYNVYRQYASQTRESFQAPQRFEFNEVIVVADGKLARLFNTVTQEMSDPMPRSVALEQIQNQIDV